MTDEQRIPMKRRLKGMMMKHMHKMITCAEFESFIGAYFDQTLPAKQRKLFELHLRFCRECRDYLAAYERSIELGRATLGDASDAIPEAVPEDLIRAILDARKQ